MGKMTHLLLAAEPSAELVMGNTAIVRAMIEAGVQVVTSYPGSPTPEIAGAIQSIPVEKRPFYFEFSTNEKVATEVAFGASVNGNLSCVFFKSVGLNVAADTFVQLGHMELIGGMIVVLGDDPGLNSSQNEQDNRHYAHLSYTPVFEPGTPTEVYEMFGEAARLSRTMRMPVIVRLTTHVCHAREKVRFGAWQAGAVDRSPRFDRHNGPYIPITSLVFPMKRKALLKREQVREYAETSASTRLLDNGNRSRGIITMGLPFFSLLDVLEETVVENRPDVLKLGIVHPLPRRRILEFLRTHNDIKILEELDDLVECEIKRLAYEHGIQATISGKIDLEDWVGEYTADKVATVLGKTWPDLAPVVDSPGKADAIAAMVPARPAQMCPGCGHRSAFHAIKAGLPTGTITVADIGCHTLGFQKPYEIGEVLLCMGHSCGTAAGLSLFNSDRPVVAFLGDSTFFHAGLPGIINALFNQHNFTLIVMENGTTAMTGHQDHPGTGRNVREVTQAVPIKKVLEGLGVATIFDTDAYQMEKLTDMVRQAVGTPGFKVIIARHPCMLKFTRDLLRRGGKRMPPIEITEACERHNICISDFACPSYQFATDGSVTVQSDLCIGDGSCRPVCPVQAIISPRQRKGATT